MIKKITTALFVLLMTNSVHADWTAKARVGAFFPVNSRFQHIYGHCIPSYELEMAKGFCQNIELWGNVNGHTKKGHSIGFNDPTRFNILNISFGAKYAYNFTCRNQVYLGLGAALSSLWLTNRSRFCHERVSKGVIGGVIKFGITHDITDCFFIDLFADYYYQPVKFETRVDVGGLKTGIGLGFRF